MHSHILSPSRILLASKQKQSHHACTRHSIQQPNGHKYYTRSTAHHSISNSNKQVRRQWNSSTTLVQSHIGVSVPCQIEFKYTRTKLQIHRVAATMASIGKGNLNFIMLHVPSSYTTKRQQFGGVSGMSCCRIYRTTHYQLMPYNNSLL
jgi:hypothetical protein